MSLDQRSVVIVTWIIPLAGSIAQQENTGVKNAERLVTILLSVEAQGKLESAR